MSLRESYVEYTGVIWSSEGVLGRVSYRSKGEYRVVMGAVDSIIGCRRGSRFGKLPPREL